MFVFVVLVVSFTYNMAFFNNLFKIRKAFSMDEMLASPSSTSTLFQSNVSIEMIIIENKIFHRGKVKEVERGRSSSKRQSKKLNDRPPLSIWEKAKRDLGKDKSQGETVTRIFKLLRQLKELS